MTSKSLRSVPSTVARSRICQIGVLEHRPRSAFDLPVRTLLVASTEKEQPGLIVENAKEERRLIATAGHQAVFEVICRQKGDLRDHIVRTRSRSPLHPENSFKLRAGGAGIILGQRCSLFRSGRWQSLDPMDSGNAESWTFETIIGAVRAQKHFLGCPSPALCDAASSGGTLSDPFRWIFTGKILQLGLRITSLKPVCAGTATAALVANIVNRGWPLADYENRRKTSSGGQRI